MKIKYLYICALALLSACTANDEALLPTSAIELKGITASIDNGTGATTRAVSELKDTIGRTAFANGDKIVFTWIKRTDHPLDSFTYRNIHYKYQDGNWKRDSNGTQKDPEKIYWTDGTSFHTFIGYSLPSAITSWELDGNGEYPAELGAGMDELDFSSLENGNKEMAKHDLLLYYNKDAVAESDGVTTKVKLTHALSNVRVIVNIKNFAASSDATDTQTKVSDFQLLEQPAKYTWGGGSNTLSVVKYADNKRKTIKLWCPKPDGEGTAQSKTFTFYGLTTPQNEIYHSITGNQQPLQFSFTVTYPDPMNPKGDPLVKTYQGAFNKTVNFYSGQCTTLNISLNHQDEQMFLGAEYSDWSFVATPDLGELRKKSTYITNVDDASIITNDQVTNADDAIWLYGPDDDVKDVYGNDGKSAAKAFRITSALQMLAFAKEVNNGYDFTGKYVRLDADITMQSSATASDYIWKGIGEGGKEFNGTFLGGDRYINRLNGSPLFVKLGENACVEQLYITAVGNVTNGTLAGKNEGIIGGCKVIDDVTLSGEGAGALVGTNTGTIHACYYTGTGNLVGTNTDGNKTGTLVGCYQASDITSFTKEFLTNFIDGTDGENPTNGLNDDLNAFYSNESNSSKFRIKFNYTFTPGNYPTVIVKNP